jgi:hypothetical protein
MERVVDLEQDRAISLHEQRVGGVILHGLHAKSSRSVRAGSPVRRELGPSMRCETLMLDAPSESRKIG